MFGDREVGGPEPDAVGPWSVLVGEGVTGACPVVSAYGPMPRGAAEALLELLDLCAFDEALVPFRNSIEVEGVTTVVVVAFGRTAVFDLLIADRNAGVDPALRWERADAELRALYAGGQEVADAR